MAEEHSSRSGMLAVLKCKGGTAKAQMAQQRCGATGKVATARARVGWAGQGGGGGGGGKGWAGQKGGGLRSVNTEQHLLKIWQAGAGTEEQRNMHVRHHVCSMFQCLDTAENRTKKEEI